MIEKIAKQVVNTAIQRFGHIDMLTNNASIFIGKPFTEYALDDFEAVLNVNVAGFFHVTQLAIRQMLQHARGHVVRITTTLVDQPLDGLPGSPRSPKVAWPRDPQLGDRICQGGILGECSRRGGDQGADASPGNACRSRRPASMERMGKVGEIVDAVLSIERAGFVTGEILNVDGGQRAWCW